MNTINLATLFEKHDGNVEEVKNELVSIVNDFATNYKANDEDLLKFLCEQFVGPNGEKFTHRTAKMLELSFYKEKSISEDSVSGSKVPLRISNAVKANPELFYNTRRNGIEFLKHASPARLAEIAGKRAAKAAEEAFYKTPEGLKMAQAIEASKLAVKNAKMQALAGSGQQ